MVAINTTRAPTTEDPGYYTLVEVTPGFGEFADVAARQLGLNAGRWRAALDDPSPDGAPMRLRTSG